MGNDLFQQYEIASDARLLLVVGGCRSGKSGFARRLVESRRGDRIYLATAQTLDDEMRERARRHQEERRERGWSTLEEPLQITRAIRTSPPECHILIDCLTLWLSNVVLTADPLPDEDAAIAMSEDIAGACRGRRGIVVAVSNEVGMGIVPENHLARRFRDLSGRMNQVLAASADAVFFMTCGLPTRIK